jgi:hypothetical protein
MALFPSTGPPGNDPVGQRRNAVTAGRKKLAIAKLINVLAAYHATFMQVLGGRYRTTRENDPFDKVGAFAKIFARVFDHPHCPQLSAMTLTPPSWHGKRRCAANMGARPFQRILIGLDVSRLPSCLAKLFGPTRCEP